MKYITLLLCLSLTVHLTLMMYSNQDITYQYPESYFHEYENDYTKEKALALLSDIFKKPIDDNLITSTTHVTISAYTATRDECDVTPFVTANMTPSRVGLLAISRDLLENSPLQMGDVVLLYTFNNDGSDECLGSFLIADKMSTHKRKGTSSVTPITNSVDILHSSKRSARIFGIKKGYILWMKGSG